MTSPVRASTLTRRAALASLSAGAVGYALLGPRPAKQHSDGRLVLDYWEKWTGHEGDAMRRIVDAFNAAQSRLFVRYFSMSAIDQKALVAIAGGAPPDIIGLWNFNIPAYAEAGAILPLDDLAAEHGIRREHYAAAVWPLMTHRPPGSPAGAPDHLWGIVSTCGSIALYYNRALFRDAGLDPDHPPRTIDEFDEAAHRLTRAGPDGRIERAGFLHTEPGWWSWIWGYHFGGSLYDPAADRATAADPRNTAAYRWVQSYPERYGPDALITFQTGLGFYGTAEHPFLQSKVAMTNQGPWLVNNIRAFKPDLDYAAAPFPVHADHYDPDRPVGLLDADVLVIPRGAKDPRAAFEFIAFTQRPENLEALALAHCKNSPLAVSSERFLAEHPNRSIAAHDAIAKSPRAFHFPRTRTWPQYEDEFDNAVERIWRLKDSAAAALATVQSRAQAQLDRAAEARRRRRDGGAVVPLL